MAWQASSILASTTRSTSRLVTSRSERAAAILAAAVEPVYALFNILCSPSTRKAPLASLLVLAASLTSMPTVAISAETEGLEPAVLAPKEAASQEPAEHPTFDPHLVLDDGRVEPTAPDPDFVRVQIHGEYQVRLARKTELPLTPPPADPSATTLGQQTAVRHWLRLTPRLDYRKAVSVIGQIDVPYGFFLGGTTRFVISADDPMDQRNPMRVDPRWLYLQVMTPVGLIRLGQQGSHWGTGFIVNDGDHPRLFGDYHGGTSAERVLFATRPLGAKSPLAVVLAGDLVYRDVQADLIEGDHAFQGILAAVVGDEVNEIGVQGSLRRQRHEDEQVAFSPFTEKLDVAVLDAFGRFATKAPGGSGYLFGEAEAAYITGATSYVRTPESATRGEDEKVRTWGGMAKLGVVHEATDGDLRWGDIVASVEWGYATGDADPNDGQQRRFTFDPNHGVGLVLFDHVLAWTTARSAVNAGDPTIVQRPNPGLQFYPSNGSVYGATYLYPTVVVRPKHWLDLKAALLVASSTADVVDPYRFGVLGAVEGPRGGDAARHDLGLEVDAGVEVRAALARAMVLQMGLQGGVLLPGHAFDDHDGRAMPTQGLGMGRLGLQY